MTDGHSDQQQTLSIRFERPIDIHESLLANLSIPHLETLSREALLVQHVA